MRIATKRSHDIEMRMRPASRLLAKRQLVGVVAGLLLMPAVSAEGAPAEQVVRGRILAPTRSHNWAQCEYGGSLGLVRVQEITGYEFDVDPETFGRPFVLAPTVGAEVDLDIIFVGDAVSGYNSIAPGGERGIVPPGATRGEVCLSRGNAIDFIYRAGARVGSPSIARESRTTDHSANLRLLDHAFTSDSPRKLAFEKDLVVSGSQDGINVFRMSDESPHLTLLSFYACWGGSGDISVWGDYVFQSVSGMYPYLRASAEGSLNNQKTARCNSTDESRGKAGIRIVDISDPRNPTQADFIETPCGSQTHTLFPHGIKVYIYVPIPCDDSIEQSPVKPLTNQIHIVRFDPDNPTKSEHVGSPTLEGQFGCYDITIFAPHELAACSHWLNPAFGTALLDVSDPANPRVVSPLPLPPDAHWVSSAAFTWDGRYLLLADMNSAEIDAHPTAQCPGQAGARGALLVIDIRDPRNPKLAGRYALPRPGTSLDMPCAPTEINVIPTRERNRYIAVVGWQAGGLTVVDLSDPAAPSEIAHWQPPPASDVLGTYWYNGRIYSAEHWTAAGIRVFELAGATSRDAFHYRLRLNPQSQLKELR